MEHYMTDTLNLKAGFDPEIRAGFERSFERCEEAGVFDTLDRSSIYESVKLPRSSPPLRRPTVQQLLKVYKAVSPA